MAEVEEQRKKVVRLLFVGAPLLDLTAPCDRRALDALGLRADDCVREAEAHAALFRSLLEGGGARRAGGSAQNSARIAKWTLAEGADVAFAGCVGRDEFAAAMEDRLRSEGVVPLYVPLPGEATGVCACLVSGEGERSMCARLGAAARLSVHHLRTADIRQRTLSSDLVYAEGYLLSHSPDVVLELARTCPAHQVLFCVGLSAEYVCRDHWGALSAVLPRVDVLLGNEAEARTLGRSLGLDDDAVTGGVLLRSPDVDVFRAALPDPLRGPALAVAAQSVLPAGRPRNRVPRGPLRRLHGAHFRSHFERPAPPGALAGRVSLRRRCRPGAGGQSRRAAAGRGATRGDLCHDDRALRGMFNLQSGDLPRVVRVPRRWFAGGRNNYAAAAALQQPIPAVASSSQPLESERKLANAYARFLEAARRREDAAF